MALFSAVYTEEERKDVLEALKYQREFLLSQQVAPKEAAERDRKVLNLGLAMVKMSRITNDNSSPRRG